MYSTRKCNHERTLHGGRRHVKNYRYVQCTEASIEGSVRSLTAFRKEKKPHKEMPSKTLCLTFA